MFTNQSAQTLRMFSLLSPSLQALVHSYVATRSPSMQSLKIFIETVMDFSPQLEGLTEYNKYSFEKLTERRSEAHMQADGLIKHIKYAKTLDNFESGELQFSFTAKNMDEYRRKLQKLESDSDLVRQLFDIVGAP